MEKDAVAKKEATPRRPSPAVRHTETPRQGANAVRTACLHLNIKDFLALLLLVISRLPLRLHRLISKVHSVHSRLKPTKLLLRINICSAAQHTTPPPKDIMDANTTQAQAKPAVPKKASAAGRKVKVFFFTCVGSSFFLFRKVHDADGERRKRERESRSAWFCTPDKTANPVPVCRRAR